MKQILYCGSSIDGYEYYIEFGLSSSDTGNCIQLRKRIDEVVLERL